MDELGHCLTCGHIYCICDEINENNTDDELKHQRLVDSIKNNEPIYLSENGYALCEEDYLNFEEWIDSVGKPEGSTVEKFYKYTSVKK